mgnify:CR=1 FL=1
MELNGRFGLRVGSFMSLGHRSLINPKTEYSRLITILRNVLLHFIKLNGLLESYGIVGIMYYKKTSISWKLTLEFTTLNIVKSMFWQHWRALLKIFYGMWVGLLLCVARDEWPAQNGTICQRRRLRRRDPGGHRHRCGQECHQGLRLRRGVVARRARNRCRLD